MKNIFTPLIKILLFSSTIFYLPCFALTYWLPMASNSVVGNIQIVQSQPNDTLFKIARQYEMGWDEIVEANPKIKKYGKLRAGTAVTIPSSFILPDTSHNGIIINLPEKRLYYYPPHLSVVITEPIAIGIYGWPTPQFIGTVLEKQKDPVWVVPDSIQAEEIEKGLSPKTIVPPGPDNPLGQYALRLSAWSILIHGTNSITSIGKRASHGCIRMYPEDIEYLFQKIDTETPVRIIDEPFKIGWRDNLLYLEIHPSLIESRGTTVHERVAQVFDMIMAATNYNKSIVDWESVKNTLIRQTGMPSLISK